MLTLTIAGEPSNPPDQSGIGEQIKELPVVITAARIKNKEAPVALLISGDGGWYKFEQRIADELAGYGILTIGLDSRKYFWKRRTPEETAADMSDILNYYGKKLDKEKYILIGYSLGAEIVPFIVNRLPAAMKPGVTSVILLSPAATTDFEIHVTNMLGIGSKHNTYDTIDEIMKLGSTRTLIIFGDGEKTNVPSLLWRSKAIIRKIPGDHHYKSNVPLIIKTLSENKTI